MTFEKKFTRLRNAYNDDDENMETRTESILSTDGNVLLTED